MKQKELIAFVGLRRSGKDSAANALVQQGWQLVKFADGLKTMLRAYLTYAGASEVRIENMIEGDWKEDTSPFFQGKSCRWAMQSLGTEWGRNCIGANFWADATIARASQFPKVVISDCRFPNEAAAIHQEGGKIIRVIRKGLTIDSHPSEQLIESIPADFEIENNGTLDDLHKKVLQLINQ